MEAFVVWGTHLEPLDQMLNYSGQILPSEEIRSVGKVSPYPDEAFSATRMMSKTTALDKVEVTGIEQTDSRLDLVFT
jgi:hypothetical protein